VPPVCPGMPGKRPLNPDPSQPPGYSSSGSRKDILSRHSSL